MTVTNFKWAGSEFVNKPDRHAHYTYDGWGGDGDGCGGCCGGGVRIV